MTNFATIRAIKKLTVQQIERVYSGKPGCMCGCNGKYCDSGFMLERILILIQSAAGEESLEVSREHGFIFYKFSETRIFCLYLNEAGRATLPEKVEVGEVGNLIEQ
jgi:hypothetical protein